MDRGDSARGRLYHCLLAAPHSICSLEPAPPRFDRNVSLLQEASAKFQSLQRIYAVLSDPKKWVST